MIHVHQKMRAYLLFFIICIFPIHTFSWAVNTPTDRNVDVCIFSYNRALQLFACLESMEKYVTGFNTIHVIFRASNEQNEEAYKIVQERFPFVSFHKQLSQNDFKSSLLQTVYGSNSQSNYMMFAVDDMIVTDFVDLQKCSNALEEYKAWGFFLRLGKNITHCYMLNQATPPPQGKDVGENGEFFVWMFHQGSGDWGYPNNTDMTIYRKQDVASFLYGDDYINPNTLEGTWQRWVDTSKIGICFQASKNINIPMNLVNECWKNRFNNSFTAEELLTKFQQGYKIDIEKFYQVKNSSPHVDYEPVFIFR